jgi:hypothetical protein
MIAAVALGLFILVPLLLLVANVSGTVVRAFAGGAERAGLPDPSPADLPATEPAVSRPIGNASTADADADVLRFTPRPATAAPPHATPDLPRSIGA